MPGMGVHMSNGGMVVIPEVRHQGRLPCHSGRSSAHMHDLPELRCPPFQAQHQPTCPIVSSATSRANPGRPARVRRRPSQVLIDHHDPAGGPAQRDRPVGQPVLQPGRLAVIGDLLARGPPDVDGR
jgi:hypothetical protein